MQSSSPCRVLVVDDDVPTSFLTRRRLETAGFSVSCALNGEDAMLLLETRQFDALIVDYQLASQNGVDFYRLAVGQGIVLPTIMVTGIEDPDLEIYALDAGMQAFVRKSITYLESLPDVINDVIDGKVNRASPARAGLLGMHHGVTGLVVDPAMNVGCHCWLVQQCCGANQLTMLTAGQASSGTQPDNNRLTTTSTSPAA